MPHPALAEIYATLVPDETPLARVKRFEKLTEAKGGINDPEKCTGCPSGCGIFPDEQLDTA